MTERVMDLLIQHNIVNDQTELLPITTGAGGAYVYFIDDTYVVKYAYFPQLDADTRKGYRNEFNFYKTCSNQKNIFIPEVILQTINDDEMLIVMKKYFPVKPEEWNENLQKYAIELCAQINAIDATGFVKIFQEQEKQSDANELSIADDNPHPLSVSYRDWNNLQIKFPKHIDAELLKEMYENFDQINSYANKLGMPETLCHGDCHPNNFLKDGDRLVICDWQGIGMGKGIGDVAFFISRGADMGIKINRDMLIESYREALLKYANIEVKVSDLHKSVAANEFGVSFRFWAGFLQTSEISRVLDIYNAMVNNYNLLYDKR